MPLLDLWRSNPATIAALTIQQIVGNAGDGDLRDNSLCATELRAYLAGVPIDALTSYIEQCLGQALTKGGSILQDLVNELGRRLDYDVENGRYSGVAGQIGFDGLWRAVGQPAMIVEVKTTDAYRLSLDTLIGYRNKLVEAGRCTAEASILIVVGRQDTGELEAQIRGSRHAWDVRLISAEALLRLVRVKESAAGAETDKIRGLLRPAEYTRLDGLVDVVFSAARDVDDAADIIAATTEILVPAQAAATGSAGPARTGGYDFTSSADLAVKRTAVMAAWSARRATSFVRRSGALFWDAGHSQRAVCSLSKRYSFAGRPYWYAFHPAWRDFLADGDTGHLLLAAMDRATALAIPREIVNGLLPSLNTTYKPEGKTYWHLHILEDASGAHSLYVPGEEPLSLTSYEFKV